MQNFELTPKGNSGKTGWGVVEAMAGKMPGQESLDNDDGDAMVNLSGRKYQSIQTIAETITAENTREYGADRRRKNYQMLLEKDKDLAGLYKDVLTEFPELSNVELINFDTRRESPNGKPNAFFNTLIKKDGQYRPVVKFNFDEPEVYFSGREGEGDAISLAQDVKKIALSVGVDANDALKNKKFMTSFLLLHELGHALDYKRNYLDKTGGNIAEAVVLNRESRRRDEMTMPMSGAVEAKQMTAEEKKELERRFSKRWASMGIYDTEHMNIVSKRKYREMHCERMADGFAKNYVLNHYGEFFTQAENPTDGRLGTKFEKSIKMGEDFAEVLGMEEGTRVRFTLISRPEGVQGSVKEGQQIDGYLGKSATLGEKMALQETNDPKNPGWRKYVSGGVESVSVIPHAILRKDTNGNEYRAINNEVRFTDKDGRIYKIEKARDQAKRIDGSRTEMLEDLNQVLGLKTGSEIQLLKRKIASRDASPIQEGELIMGRLTTDGIRLGGVEMITDDGKRLKTSFIDDIYREWKTFYIDTATSTYEVIPVRS